MPESWAWRGLGPGRPLASLGLTPQPAQLQRQGLCSERAWPLSTAGVPMAGHPMKGGPGPWVGTVRGASFIGQIEGREVAGRTRWATVAAQSTEVIKLLCGRCQNGCRLKIHRVAQGTRELSGGDREKRVSMALSLVCDIRPHGSAQGGPSCRPRKRVREGDSETSLGTQCRRAGLGSRPLTGKLALPFTSLAVALGVGARLGARFAPEAAPAALLPLHPALDLQAETRRGSWDTATPREWKPPGSSRVSATR